MRSLKKLADRVMETDVLVVGSEGAGARAAIEAVRFGARALIATKGRIARTGATITAGADFTVDGKSAKEICGLTGDERDSPEKFFEDLVTEGLFLGNQEIVQAYVEGAPIILKDMMEWGMKIFYYQSSHFQEVARGAFSNGPEIVKALRRGASLHDVPLVEDVMVTDLLTRGGRCVGAAAIDMNTGEFLLFKAKAVILATGGWQRAYSFSSAPYELTGDGQAMAYRAGAELLDMEMVQFVPGIILHPPMFKSYITVYLLYNLLSEGGLVNSLGERFMKRYDPEHMEHSTKEIISIGLMREVMEGRGSPQGGVWWSFKDADKNRIVEISDRMHGMGKWFETGSEKLIQLILDGNDIGCGVAAHFMIGGIKVDRHGRTNIPGLFAAGECSGGMWGATRVASAISQAIIQGMYAGRAAANYRGEAEEPMIDPEQAALFKERVYRALLAKDGAKPIEERKRLQSIADQGMGVIRNGKDMKMALEAAERMAGDAIPELCVRGTKSKRWNLEWIEAIQLENMRQCLELSAASGLNRTESRGAHYRTDYEMCDNEDWLKNTIQQLDGGKRTLKTQQAAMTRLRPRGGVMTYQEAAGIGTASLK